MYPTDEFLEEIKKEELPEFHAFMAKIKEQWEFADWGWSQEGNFYRISTGGWSGNEDIIGAMRSNFVFWSLYWCQSRRGGHYIFAPCKDWIDRDVHKES